MRMIMAGFVVFYPHVVKLPFLFLCLLSFKVFRIPDEGEGNVYYVRDTYKLRVWITVPLSFTRILKQP